MALCVVTLGTIGMPLWSADSWGSPPMVSRVLKYIHSYDEMNYISRTCNAHRCCVYNQWSVQ